MCLLTAAGIQLAAAATYLTIRTGPPGSGGHDLDWAAPAGHARLGLVPPVPESSAGPLVLHAYGYRSGRESPDGALVHSGPKRSEGYHYIAPDGAHHQRNWSYNKDGSPTGIIGHGLTGPVVNGKQVVTLTVINHAKRTYSLQQTEHSVTGGAGAGHVYGTNHSGVMLRPASRRNAAADDEIEDLLRSVGCTQVKTEALPLSPPVICVLATSPDPDTSHPR